MKISRDKINHLSSLISKDFEQRDEIDYKVDLNEVRIEIARVITEELKVDDQADVAARKIIESYTTKNVREGTPEWDILYEKHYNEYLNKRGL